MRVRSLGQFVLGFAFLLIAMNLLEAKFGQRVVRGWFHGWTPVDVMFLVAVGLVGLLVLGSGSQRPPPGPPGRTHTIW